MGFIYKITNKITNEIYIGQTKKTVHYRFLEHFRQAKTEAEGKRKLTHFHAALNKYGQENFIVETIEECDNNLLNEKEIYWIKYYDSYNNGYNSTTGGQNKNNSFSTKMVLQYGLNGEYIQMFENAEEAANFINGDTHSIRLCCNPNYPLKSYKQYQWRYFELNFPLHIQSVTGTSGIPSKKVIQYDKQGNILNIFKNAPEASKNTGINRRSIAFVCEHVQKTAGGFQWRYENDTDIPQDLEIVRLAKYCNPLVPIIQKDKNGLIIQEWNSIIEAGNILMLDKRKIGDVCEGKQGIYHNFKWEYKI